MGMTFLYLQYNYDLINRWNLLHRAAELGKTDVCKLLLVHGALINARTVWGWHTPLHLALSNGFLETATFLMDAGADVNAKNKYKMNAVAYAQHRGQNTVVKDFQAVYLRKEMMKIIKL